MLTEQRRSPASLSAGDAHVALHGWLVLTDIEIVAFRLAGQQTIEFVFDGRSPAASDEIAKLHLLIMPQTAEHRSGRGHPNAVAARAEIVAQRRDQSKLSAGLRHLIVAGRAAGPIERRDQSVSLLELGLHQVEGDVTIDALLVDVAQRHG